MSSLSNTHEHTMPQFLSGGGEMGKLIRSKDWSKTALGSPDTWPQSLRTSVSLCIASNFPIDIVWGPHRVQIYNDGYWPITGDKHPDSMGQDFKECWLSAWPVIGQAFEEASLGETRFLENQRIFIDRYGYLEETFFTFSFSPILDESGSVGGLFHPVVELTQQTLAERRLNILRAVADNTVNAKTAAEAASLILECLKDFELDLPFALLYSIAANGKEANLAGSMGVERNSSLAPVTINLEVQQPKTWPLTEVIKKGKAVPVEELPGLFGTFNCGPYPEPPHQALVFPVSLHGTVQNNYFLVLGVSSRRSLDEKYLLFYELLTSSIHNALTKARAHEEERQKSEALAEIDKAKTVFFSNISHEFRTPLTLILSPLEELLNQKKSNFSEIEKGNIETTHRNAIRLLKLVNTLLDFSRIESGRVQAMFSLVDIVVLTKNLASNFRSVIEKAGLKLIVIADSIIQPVYVDKQMWEKIVFNLLSNAFKYTLEGNITVQLLEEEDFVVLKVADTGVGIPEAELPKMFKRFHRIQNVSGRTYEGTGIGLSLIKELVQMHHGTIGVESVHSPLSLKEGSGVRSGSVFTVKIPTGKKHIADHQIVKNEIDSDEITSNIYVDEVETLVETNNKQKSNSTIRDRGKKNTFPTILVVDDNADMRELIHSILSNSFNVITADNGMDALHKMKETIPALVLSDIMMPVMDGIGLLKEIKSNKVTANIPVIFLTARAGEESKIEGLETGADDYLVKPFSSKELLTRVGAQIKLKKLQKEAVDTLSKEEKRQAFLLKLSDALRPLGNPADIEEAAAKIALDFMDADRCYYSTIKEDNVIILRDAFRRELPSVAGVYPISSFALYKAVLNAGHPFVVDDVPTSGLLDEDLKKMCLQFQYGSFINVPVIKNGKAVGLFSLVQNKPRKWTDLEMLLTIETAERTWAAVERSKAEESLHSSEEKYRMLFDSIDEGFSILEILFDDKGKVVDYIFREMNNAHEAMTGVSPKAVGMRISELMPYMEESVLERLGQVVSTGEPVRYEQYVSAWNRWFDVHSSRVGGEGSHLVANVFSNITDRKQAEEKIRESENRFRTMADASPVLIWTIEANGLSSYYNKTFRDFIGVSESEDISDWEKIVHPDDIQTTLDTINTAIAERRSYALELRLLRADGRWRSVLAQGNLRTGANNEFLGFVGSSVDITERKEAESKIKESEKKFEAAILAVEGIIWTNNAVGEMQGEQPAWSKLTGQSFEEYKGYGWANALHPDDAQPTIDAWNEAVKNKITFEFEHRLLTKQDGWRIFSVRAVPAFDEYGNIQQWVGVHTDITEQRETAQKIKESESYFRRLTDTVPAILWITESDGSCSYLNKLWYDYTGQTEEEAKGFGWLEATHPDDKEQAAEIFIKANAAQQPYSILYRLRNSKGEYRWAVDSGSPRFNATHEFEGMIGTVIDVHEEKLAEEKLAYRTALLEAHNQANVDGILLVDAKGKIISYNQRFIEIWNMPQDIVDAKNDEAALSFAMMQLVNPQQFIDKVKNLYEHPIETSLDELEFKDGKIVERNGYPVIGEDGNYYAWSWTFADITERKRTEQDLKNTKGQLELTFTHIPAGVYLINNKGELVYVNEKGAAVYGDFTPENLLAKKDLIVLLKEADELFERFDENGERFYPQHSPAYITLSTGKPSQAVLIQIDKKTQEKCWYFVQGAPLFDDDGKVSMVLVTSTDITVQKLAEEKIKESEGRFRSLGNSIPQLAWMADAEGSIYWYNQRWYDYTGTTLEQMQGWGWKAVHHPEHVDRVEREFKNAIATREPYDDTFMLRSKDGEYRWFLTRAVPIHNAAGQVIQWFGTNTDVSVQRETQEALKDVKEKLELTFKNVPSAIYHFNKEGKILYLNQLGATQLGYETVEEVMAERDIFGLEKKLDSVFIVLNEKGETLNTTHSTTAQTLQSGKPAEVISQFVHRQTGLAFWLLSRSSPLFNENGELSIVLTTSTDISLQKNSEQAIRLSEERFRTLSETLPQLVWMTDVEGAYEYASGQWRNYSGFDPQEDGGWEELVHADDMQPLMNAWSHSRRTGETYMAEARLKNKDGEYRWHFVQGEPIRSEEGTVLKWIGAFTDIHDQKTLSEKLEKIVSERTKELKRSNEDLQQFAHVASHDLKEPLRKIRTFGNRLTEEFGTNLPVKAKTYIEKMDSAATRLSTMIDGVLIYSSLDSDVILTEVIDLGEIISSIQEDLEVLIAQKNAVIQSGNLPYIEGSSVLLYQLFYNLMNNSLKFSMEGRPMVLQISSETASATDLKKYSLEDSEQDYVKIIIQDNGIGFGASEEEKIFRTFTRLHSKDLYEGTGLGLALCKKIVERHGGAISAKGIENKGATFEIFLPLKQEKLLKTN